MKIKQEDGPGTGIIARDYGSMADKRTHPHIIGAIKEGEGEGKHVNRTVRPNKMRQNGESQNVKRQGGGGEKEGEAQ